MKNSSSIAGLLFFVAASEFVIGMIVAEALYPGYSVGARYISDLGVGPSSTVFNSSVFLLGLLMFVGTYFLHRKFNYKLLTGLLILAAIGAMGVGVFTENSPAPAHSVVSLIAFLFGGLSAITSFKLLKMPFSVVAVILGLVTLCALGLFAGNFDLGLGVGGIERMIAYPILLWGAGFGGYLMTDPAEANATKPR
jgi:hypothetical membrane protein